MSSCVYLFRCAAPRVNPNVNYRLWIIMMCQRRFTNCNKRTTPVREVDNVGGCARVGAGSIWEVSVPFSY